MTQTTRLDLFDWEPLPITAIELTTEQLQIAATQAQTGSDPGQQWQTYLAALAQVGLVEWLLERAPDLPLNQQPAGLSIGAYRVCPLVVGETLESIVAVESPCNADLWILIEVLEEQAQVQINGYLWQHQLPAQIKHQLSSSEQLSNLLLPKDLFTFDPDRLLLELRCLPVNSAAIPVIPTVAPSVAGKLSQPLINVGYWLGDRLDQMAQTLNWILLPPLAPAAGFRSHPTALERITTELANQGLPVPPEARAGYHDFILNSEALRLYAIVWTLPQADPPSWRLRLVLLSASEGALSPGLRLQVWDESQLLADQSQTETTLEGCLYAEVEGVWQEGFYARITTANGLSLSLPMFTCAAMD